MRLGIGNIAASSAPPRVSHGSGSEVLARFVEAGAGTAFDPIDRGASLIAWYRPDAGVITQASNAISAWADKSGTGDSNKNLVNGGGSPLWNSSDVGYNNKPTVSFSGSVGEYFQSGAWAASLAQPLTIYVVGQCTQATVEAFYDNRTATEVAMYTTGAGTLNILAGSAVLGSKDVTSKSVMCAVFNGASSALYVNDHTTAVVSGDPGANGLTGFIIGANISGIARLVGKVGEIVIVSAADTLAQRLAMMNYLGAEYGITVT